MGAQASPAAGGGAGAGSEGAYTPLTAPEVAAVEAFPRDPPPTATSGANTGAGGEGNHAAAATEGKYVDTAQLDAMMAKLGMGDAQ